MINGEPKLKLRKNDSYGRIIFQGKEMLYADKRLTKKESEYYCGAKGKIYNCFIQGVSMHHRNKKDCAVNTVVYGKDIY